MESRICDSFEFLRLFAVILSLILVSAPGARSWSKEGHIVTCRIAQVNKMLVVCDLSDLFEYLNSCFSSENLTFAMKIVRQVTYFVEP